MLISRAPLRISLAGGGTDLPAYYERFGGMVVSTTISKFVYVHVRPNGANGTHITSADYQTFYQYHGGEPMTWDGELALPRAVLHEFSVERGLSIFLASEVPPGTGLGSSSAVAVALVQGVASYLHQPLSKQRVAEMACQVELQKLGAPIGKQDQFAAAFGGLNAITFDAGGVTVEPLHVSNVMEQLERRLLLFFTGTARNSTVILKEQQRSSATGSATTIEGLHRIKDAARECRRCLERGDLDGIGALLDEGWRHKKQLAAGITNPRIDEAYSIALESGAIGGKITGAGGGGFLLLYCHEEHQQGLADAMGGLGLKRMDLHFETQGATIASVSWDLAKGVTENASDTWQGHRKESEPLPVEV
jgi:D-glycero-alpha-D-manno-heptose-7-phosphate kinase